MKTKYLAVRELFYIIAVSLVMGALLSSIEDGNWLMGFITFSFLFFLSLTVLTIWTRWAIGVENNERSNDRRRSIQVLGWIVALAFILRLGAGVTFRLALPIYGYDDEDDRAGYVFTDAHRRDNQAWELATSKLPVIDAFSKEYGSDQYGGLLAFNTFVYRYFSPDAQRPLLLILLSAFFAALGVPFFWKAVSQVFGEQVAWPSTWIFALYLDSILLGASAMREPYLLTFSTLVLWGFVHRFYRFEESPSVRRLSDLSNLLRDRIGWLWIALGLLGMLLVSPAIALVTIIAFAGWIFFTNERREISWRGITAIVVLFLLGLLFLSSSLNRSGEFIATSPLHVINDWFQAAVKWDAYQLERDSGWVQKIFDEGPRWIRLPFVAIYGIFQPVLPAAIFKPTKLIWQLIGITRAVNWYALLPMLILSFVAAAGQEVRKTRNLVLWLSLLTWSWILLAALRGGADLFDNPRYRTILFVYQSIIVGFVWVWWKKTQNVWMTRILLMELVFLLFFTQWYASRYFYWGGQLPFGVMVGLILGGWGIILGVGVWRDKRRTPGPRIEDPAAPGGSSADKRSTPQSGSGDKRSNPAGKSRA